MIYKRYQYYTFCGIAWSEWFPYDNGTQAKAKELNKSEKYQLKSYKLLNEFKYE